MEQTIQEAQLEKMRLKAKKLEKVVIVLSVVMLLVYIVVGCMLAFQENGIATLSGVKAVIFVVEIILVVAVVALGTGLLLWMIIVKHAYDKFNLGFKSKYVLQVINAVEGFEKLQYVPKGGFTWDDVRNAAAVNCGDKRYYDSEDLWTIVNKKDTIFKYIFWERLDSLPIPECCFHFVWCQIA